MKLALATIVKNEEKFLKIHFPVMLPYFDGFVAVDTGSTDNTKEVIKELGGVVEDYSGPVDFSRFCNHMIDLAEREGYDAIIMLAADEVILPEHIKYIRDALVEHDAASFPRIEFVEDRLHFDPEIYPDYQCRAHVLNKGIHWRNKIHEMLFDSHGEVLLHSDNVPKIMQAHILHYGRIRDKDFLAKKYTMYNQLSRDLKPDVESVKADEGQTFYKKKMKFIGKGVFDDSDN